MINFTEVLSPFYLLATSREIPKEFPTTGETVLFILGIVFFLVLNAFFVASEFAIVKVRPSQLATGQASDQPGAGRNHKVARRIVSRLESYLSANQLGITFSSLALGFLGEPFVMKLVAPALTGLAIQPTAVYFISLILAYTVFTFLHVVVGELVPKSLAIRYPLRTTLMLAAPLELFFRLFAWAIAILNGSANFLLRNILRINPESSHSHVHSAEELAVLVTESQRQQEVTETEREILINALELSEITVKDVMTPRGSVVVLDIDAPFEKNLDIVRRSQHTRFPVVRGHLDRAIGQVHVKDFLKLVGRSNPDLMAIRRELKVVPETMPLDRLLKFFLNHHAHLALVVDEFGDSSGLVFLDNVLEELVGDIQDEFDQEHPDFTRISADEFVVKGMLPLIELADEVEELDLDAPEVTTIGGYVVQQLGRIPEVGDEMRIRQYRVRVLSTDGRRIGSLNFRRMDEESADSGEGGEASDSPRES